MQNLKIRLDNDEQIEEIDNIAGQVGLNIIGIEIEKKPNVLKWVFLSKNKTHNGKPSKEITLPELRAMANPMKEYLNANCNYEFVLSNKKYDGFIEIPEGMNFAYKDDMYTHFTKMEMGYRDAELIWQREQDEPFLTPETTLNDQYAEIEQVRQVEIHGTIKAEPDFNFGATQANGGVDATLSQRQSQYGCYEDVAHVTQQILSALRIGNYDELPAPMKESLHMIASKMARIVNGDPEYLDNWHDIGGYSKLIEKLIKGE